MLFTDWCRERGIGTVWCAALWQYILATRPADKTNDPDEWAKAYTEFMQEYSKDIGVE